LSLGATMELKEKIKKIKELVQVEDTLIINREPKVIILRGIPVVIQQVPYLKKWRKFCGYFASFLQEFYIALGISDLPDNLNEVEKFRHNLLMALGVNKKMFSLMVKICRFATFKGFLGLYFAKKMFSIDDWVEVFLWVYYYNIKSVKKKLYDVYGQLFKVQ